MTNFLGLITNNGSIVSAINSLDPGAILIMGTVGVCYIAFNTTYRLVTRNQQPIQDNIPLDDIPVQADVVNPVETIDNLNQQLTKSNEMVNTLIENKALNEDRISMLTDKTKILEQSLEKSDQMISNKDTIIKSLDTELNNFKLAGERSYETAEIYKQQVNDLSNKVNTLQAKLDDSVQTTQLKTTNDIGINTNTNTVDVATNTINNTVDQGINTINNTVDQGINTINKVYVDKAVDNADLVNENVSNLENQIYYLQNRLENALHNSDNVTDYSGGSSTPKSVLRDEIESLATDLNNHIANTNSLTVDNTTLARKVDTISIIWAREDKICYYE